MSSRRVLIITYHFPPFRTAGVYRHLKFVKYLRDFGWEPWVLTVKNPSKQLVEESLANELPPDLTVMKTHTVELPNRRMVDRLATDLEREGFFRKAIRKILKRCVFVPDDKIGWLPHTLYRALQAVKQHDVDLVCTTSPPHSTHMTGLLLKRFCGVPWVVEFRDPWTDTFGNPEFGQVTLRHRLEHAMQRAVLRAADRVVTVSEGHKQRLLSVMKFAEPKVSVITNGYDESDFAMQDESRGLNEGKFAISMVGYVYPDKADCFLTAVKELALESQEFRESAVVRFVGVPSPSLQRSVAALELDDVIRVEGFREHADAIRDMQASSLLLLLVGTDEAWIPGKLFEYLRAGRPILVVGVAGDAARIAVRSGLGTVVSPSDVEEVKRTLRCVFKKSRAGDLTVVPDRAYISGFERRELTRRFALILDETLGAAAQKDSSTRESSSGV